MPLIACGLEIRRDCFIDDNAADLRTHFRKSFPFSSPTLLSILLPSINKTSSLRFERDCKNKSSTFKYWLKLHISYYTFHHEFQLQKELRIEKWSREELMRSWSGGQSFPQGCRRDIRLEISIWSLILKLPQKKGWNWKILLIVAIDWNFVAKNAILHFECNFCFSLYQQIFYLQLQEQLSCFHTYFQLYR